MLFQENQWVFGNLKKGNFNIMLINIILMPKIKKDKNGKKKVIVYKRKNIKIPKKLQESPRNDIIKWLVKYIATLPERQKRARQKERLKKKLGVLKTKGKQKLILKK